MNQTVTKSVSITVNPSSTKKLLTGANFVYQGSFRVPQNPPGSCSSFAYVGDTVKIGCAFNPANKSLFLVGTAANSCVQLTAEISIPQIVNSGTVGNLKTSTLIQNFGSLTGGLQNVLNYGGNGTEVAGLCVVGSTIYWAAYSYYDGAGVATLCLGKSTTNIASPNAQGMYGINAQGTPAGAMGGWVSPIPTNWQPLFGGYPLYCGLGGISIISRSSFGCAMVGFDPSKLSTSTPAPGQTYIFYPQDQAPMLGYHWCPWPTAPAGSCFIDTGSLYGIVFVGFKALGDQWYGLPTGGPNGESDPCNGDKGNHCSGGTLPVMWVFDPNAVVKNAASGQYWATNPAPAEYALGGSGSPNPYLAQECAYLSGLTFDSATNTLYLVQPFADSVFPLIHIYSVQ